MKNLQIYWKRQHIIKVQLLNILLKKQAFFLTKKLKISKEEYRNLPKSNNNYKESIFQKYTTQQRNEDQNLLNDIFNLFHYELFNSPLMMILQLINIMEAPPINEDQMDQLLEWIDGISFSRPKKNLSRDFSDGVLVAEIIKQYHPKLVHLHNYPSASALNAKFNNWKTLNQKVFKKLKFMIHPNDIQNVITIIPGSIEKVLFLIYSQLRKQDKQRLHTNTQGLESQISGRPENNENSQIASQLAERQDTIKQLRTTIEILQTKMRKIEQLNRLKDVKIQSLIRKLQEGIN